MSRKKHPPFRPTRKMFADRNDYLQAVQVYELVDLAMEYGATLREIRLTLEKANGAFGSWEFLWEREDES